MRLFRIVQDRKRAKDLSGTGAFRWGGRWNSKGTYMLYCSENSSLALLEKLVHFDQGEMPPRLYVVELELSDKAPLYTLPENQYHKAWMKLSLLENQTQGDQWMREAQYPGVRVRSAVNIAEYNCLLNPLYPGFHGLVSIISVKEIVVDQRLL
ncbi:MAG: RES family NAD+ phosphorylase [Bacteroidota bacterium]|nr:RES family NAD+ phosphorylase [Bacteroidota bacterium]